MKPKAEKWKVTKGEGDPGRYVVDGKNTLIADCYADSSDRVGLPGQKQARKNAKRIAMLPEMVELLRRVGETVPYGCLTHSKVNSLLVRYDRLIPKTDNDK